MTILKATPQFSIWCDECPDFVDFTAFDTRALAVKYFRSLGWVIGKKVKCPECAAPNKSAHPTPESGGTSPAVESNSENAKPAVSG